MDETRDSRFALLARVVEISNSNIQVENRLKHVCDFLARELPASCICVYRRDRRSDDLLPWVSSRADIEESAQMEFRIRIGEGVSGKAAQKRVPVFIRDVVGMPPLPAVPQEIRDFTSILSIPIMDDVHLYGVMNVSNVEETEYPEETQDVLRFVATEVAGAIRNSRLYDDARKRVSELITLNEIGRAITSTFQVRDILGYVAKTTSRLLQSHGCTVRLAGDVRGHFKVMIDEGYAEPVMRRELRALGKVLAAQIAREKSPLLINGPEDSPLHLSLARRGVTSFLGLPILSKGKALGVISYYSASRAVIFDMEVVHLMQTVCTQLANMIENLTMFREAQQLALENQVKVQRFSVLYKVARALMSTVKTDRLLNIMMHALTSGTGLNFSRGILFLLSSDGKTLAARIAMGPRNRKEARRRPRKPTVPYDGAEGGGAPGSGEEFDDILWPDIDALRLSLEDSECLIGRAITEKKPIRAVSGCPRTANAAPGIFCGSHPPAFASVPLLIKGEARGAIYADNLFREREITDEDIQILTMFASEASLALENASLYESLEGALATIRETQDRLLQSEKLAALGEMAAQIAHEIKNPLTIIGGFAGRMMRKDADIDHATTARYSTIILGEVQRLERIVKQTLYFSREMAPAFRTMDANVVVRDTLGLFREEFEKARIVTETRLEEGLPFISADPDQIRQVLWNLVANAGHAMAGGGTLTVTTRAATPEEGDGIVIVVGDTGGGIPHDVVHNIFNPFFTTKSKGTGLGLPIIHAIVEKHGGSIHLDNREGEGVTFSVFLPRSPKERGAGERILTQIRKGLADVQLAKPNP